jgi:hypothetical protein
MPITCFDVWHVARYAWLNPNTNITGSVESLVCSFRPIQKLCCWKGKTVVNLRGDASKLDFLP